MRVSELEIVTYNCCQIIFNKTHTKAVKMISFILKKTYHEELLHRCVSLLDIRDIIKREINDLQRSFFLSCY